MVAARERHGREPAGRNGDVTVGHAGQYCGTCATRKLAIRRRLWPDSGHRWPDAGQAAGCRTPWTKQRWQRAPGYPPPMVTALPGRCAACGKTGPASRTRSFLCNECVHPSEVRSYCSRCKTRTTYAQEGHEAVARLLASSDVAVDNSLGLIIVLATCAECRAEDEPVGRVLVYQIGEPADI